MLIIGDVHGCYKTLIALVQKCPPEEQLCFVGDLIDRGPQSREVIDFVKDGGHPCVRGNHEDMALWHYGREPNRNSIYSGDVWLRNGGKTAVASYPEGRMSDEHLDFLASLPYILSFRSNEKSLIVSHSSFSPRLSYKDLSDAKKFTEDPNTIDNSVLWNRGPLVVAENSFHVFGHTPHNQEVIRGDHANVDTGGFFRKMTALRYPQMEIYEQQFIG